jgi:hypothetical protein
MRPLTGREPDELLRAAVAAPSMHNTQPWKFRFAGSVVEVHRDRERELPAEDPDRRMLYLSPGAAVFNLRVGAARPADGTDVRSVLDRRGPDLVAEVGLVGGSVETEQLYRLAPYVQARRTTGRSERVADEGAEPVGRRSADSRWRCRKRSGPAPTRRPGDHPPRLRLPSPTDSRRPITDVLLH